MKRAVRSSIYLGITGHDGEDDFCEKQKSSFLCLRSASLFRGLKENVSVRYALKGTFYEKREKVTVRVYLRCTICFHRHQCDYI